MTSDVQPIEATLGVAEHVANLLRAEGIGTVLIGAMALAVHGYPRDTVDLDLAAAIDPARLEHLASLLRAAGYAVDVYLPDAADPLGGVLDVRADGAALVQVVSFLNPPAQGFPKLVADAIATSTPVVPESTLLVVDLMHLIVFKLYAGGRKSELDILELLDRHAELDREALRRLCRDYRLEVALDQVLASAV